MMNHKQRCQEEGPGPVVLIVSTNCEFILFWLSYPLINNVVGLVITHRVIGASPRRNGVRQQSWDRRNGSE